MDWLRTLGRAHVNEPAPTEQVTALDEFSAHPARKECVLEVRRVVDTGVARRRSDRDVSRRRRRQRTVQTLWVFRHRAHPVAGEDLRDNVRKRPAVLQHVRDTGRTPKVVFENMERPLFIANKVNARHVDPNPIGRNDPVRLPVVVTGAW